MLPWYADIVTPCRLPVKGSLGPIPFGAFVMAATLSQLSPLSQCLGMLSYPRNMM